MVARLTVVVEFLYAMNVLKRKVLIVTAMVLPLWPGFAVDSSKSIVDYSSEIDEEVWMPIIQSVSQSDYDLHVQCYHESCVVVKEFDGKSIGVVDYLKDVKAGFEEDKKRPNSTYLKMRFDQRINNESNAFETGVFLFSTLGDDGERITRYIQFEMLLTKESGRWQVLMENQKNQVTLSDWNESGQAGKLP